MPGIAVLNDVQLRQLAKCIHHQEVEAVKNIKFKSEPEVAKYIRDSKSNYQSVLMLLDSGSEMVNNFQGHETQAHIAHDIFSYIVHTTNMALQSVRNYVLRSNYLTKIRDHANELIQQLRALNPGSVINVQRLAEEAVQYRNAMMEYTRSYQNSISRNFSKWLKETGRTFEQLIETYKRKLNFRGLFRDLQDAQKIQVYEEIIAASGRGKRLINQFAKGMGRAGTLVFLFTAGVMVWDIFSSENKMRTAAENGLSMAATIGGAMLGEAAGVALANLLVNWVAIEASPLLLMGAGIVGAISGAFLLGLFAGWLVGYLFPHDSAGTTTTSSTTDGHAYYLAPMPDGEALARQIVHHDNSSRSG